MGNQYDKAMELAGRGKDSGAALRDFHREELLHFKELGIDKVEVLTAGAGNSYEECLKLSQVRYTDVLGCYGGVKKTLGVGLTFC